MRRFLTFALALIVLPGVAPAQGYTGLTWDLLAIDGQVVEDRATLRIDVDNVLAGAAPCNRWSATNGADLPALQLGAIRSTRMACDKLAAEQAFFDALSLMTSLAPDGDSNLILTGPDGHSMEFVIDRTRSLTVCQTCPAKD